MSAREDCRERLLSLLPETEEEAVSMAELAKLLSVTDRELRSLVEGMRRDHVGISSSDAGYWYPIDADRRQQDVERTASRLESMAKAALLTASRMREGLRKGACDGKEAEV